MRQLADIIGSATGRPAEIEAITGITEDTYRHVADISKIRSLGVRAANLDSRRRETASRGPGRPPGDS